MYKNALLKGWKLRSQTETAGTKTIRNKEVKYFWCNGPDNKKFKLSITEQSKFNLVKLFLIQYFFILFSYSRCQPKVITASFSYSHQEILYCWTNCYIKLLSQYRLSDSILSCQLFNFQFLHTTTCVIIVELWLFCHIVDRINKSCLFNSIYSKLSFHCHLVLLMVVFPHSY